MYGPIPTHRHKLSRPNSFRYMSGHIYIHTYKHVFIYVIIKIIPSKFVRAHMYEPIYHTRTHIKKLSRPNSLGHTCMNLSTKHS